MSDVRRTTDAELQAAGWELSARQMEVERDTLRAEVERLRGALRLLHDNVVLAFPTLADLGPVANARAALEGKHE